MTRDIQDLHSAISAVLGELLDGANPDAGWLLNPNDVGLLRSLDRLTAEAASRPGPDGSASIAAHVDHLCYGFSLNNRWSRGEEPFGDADWKASWKRTSVSPAEWDSLRADLRSEAAEWQTGIERLLESGETELSGAIASVAHLAYHLGAIRQISRAARGPTAEGWQPSGPERPVDDLGTKLVSPEPTVYLRVEYERRFLVSPDAPWRDFVEPYSKRFEDYYLRGSRLRLRTLTDSATGNEFIKLTKKLESSSPYFQSMGSIPLSPFEYDFLEGLEGDRLTKRRFYHFHGGSVFSIDVFEGDLLGLVLCEVEKGGIDELMRIEPPDYTLAEVTEDRFFTGGSLCRTSRSELARKLAEMGITLA